MSLKNHLSKINALREECVPKIDFAELESRVETLEETKVNREEMGRLLEPGFVDNFLEEQESLRADVDGLKKTVSYLEEDLNNLTTRVEEEIVKSMEQQFEEIGQMLEVMNAKLATLDADEINDSFANLEDQAAMLIKELEDMKNAHDLFKKEAKLNFNKISNVNALLDKLEQSKVDKSKLYELLELKADVDMIRNKLDRSEFLSMKRTIMEDLERLTITVKINEEEMSEGIRKLRQDFALKMYTEDFVTATEPIRNRIKALMYELKKVKEIALAQLFPDAPGVIKCFGCKRAANLLSYNYQGSGDDEDPPISQRTRSRAVANSSQPTSKTTSDLRFPPIDIDNVPIPPPDKKREVPPDQLPMLIANAKPNIGLPWERRKADIDRELRAYFATRKIRPIGGGYTQSQPQQKGLKFTTKVLKSEKVVPEIKSLREPKEKKGFIKPVLKKVPPSSSRRNLVPSSIGLHVNEDPAKTTSYTIEADRIDAEQSETDSNSSDIKNKNEEQ
ncbi:uncharacterized protein LOC129222282 isoform X2 [Uloborus diversus]|uniref:uncharacterized protein LOC129222282 isoform X2 n=1 Tax=Uloborus diversus TaxID=327109 RepID=UPI002409D3EB|nr:uncharacterized protein LOC129222282 isoform X2 [Uloborus diversus]